MLRERSHAERAQCGICGTFVIERGFIPLILQFSFRKNVFSCGFRRFRNSMCRWIGFFAYAHQQLREYSSVAASRCSAVGRIYFCFAWNVAPSSNFVKNCLISITFIFRFCNSFCALARTRLHDSLSLEAWRSSYCAKSIRLTKTAKKFL